MPKGSWSVRSKLGDESNPDKIFVMNYLVIGDDEYIQHKEIERIRDKFLAPGERSLNYSEHEHSDASGIITSLTTLPFLAENRVVLAKDAQLFDESSIKTILSYLEKPSGKSILILSSDASFTKSKDYKRISSLAEVIGAARPSILDIKTGIRGFFKKENIEISSEAVDLIAALKGDDSGAVTMELEKLVSFSGGAKIETSHVEEIVGRSTRETVFKLMDAINARSAEWAFMVLLDLYDTGKESHEIIGYISWYLRIMQKIVLLESRGMGIDRISAELKYSSGYVRRLSTEAKKYSISEIKRRTELLLEADKDIKTGKKEARLALEALIVSLFSGFSKLRS